MVDKDIENITEQQYLELAKSSQEKFNEYDLKNRKLINQINELKKSVVCAYAFSKKIDEIIEEIEMPSTYKTIIEYMVREIRSDLSAAVFNLEHQDELDDLEVVNIFQTS
jgi:malate synthase